MSFRILMYAMPILSVLKLCTCHPSIQLKHDLLSGNYSKITIPLGDEPLQVQHAMSIRKLVDVDCPNRILQLSVWSTLSWRDYRLAWDPVDYNGTHKIQVLKHDIWMPDVSITDNADINYVMTQEERLTIRVSHTGHVAYNFPAIYIVGCFYNLYKFPYDKQSCSIGFSSWSYDTTRLKIVNNQTNTRSVSQYEKHNEWAFVDIESEVSADVTLPCCSEPIDRVLYTIHLRRRSIPYFYYMYLPNILLNIVNIMKFLLPCDSTEKMFLGMGTILCLMMYLNLAVDLLPMSNQAPVLLVFMSVTFLLVAVSLVFAIFILELHNCGKHDNHLTVPHVVRVVVLHYMAKIVGLSKYITSDEEHEYKLHCADNTSHISLNEEEEEADDMDETETSFGGGAVKIGARSMPYKESACPSLKPDRIRQRKKSIVPKACVDEMSVYKIYKHAERWRDRQSEEVRDREERTEWQQIAMVLDRFMVILYFIVTVALWAYTFGSRDSSEGELDG